MAIYSSEGGYSCSSGGTWIPGVYESAKACRMAFKLPDSALWELWSSKMIEDGSVPDGVYITESDLRAVRLKISAIAGVRTHST